MKNLEFPNFAALDTTSIGKLHGIGQRVRAIYTIPAGQHTALSNLQQQIENLLEQIMAIDEQIQNDSPQTSQLIAQRDVLEATISSLGNTMTFMLGLLETQRQTEAVAAAHDNGNIGTALACDANEKAVYAAYLNMAQGGSAGNGLAAASQCALAGGPAVYAARSLKSCLTMMATPDEVCCSNVPRPASDREHQISMSAK